MRLTRTITDSDLLGGVPELLYSISQDVLGNTKEDRQTRTLRFLSDDLLFVLVPVALAQALIRIPRLCLNLLDFCRLGKGRVQHVNLNVDAPPFLVPT